MRKLGLLPALAFSPEVVFRVDWGYGNARDDNEPNGTCNFTLASGNSC